MTDILANLKQAYPWPEESPRAPTPDETSAHWFNDDNRAMLAPHLGPDVKGIIELGTWLGASARWMLDNAPNAVCICVDWWQGDQYINRSPRFHPLIHRLYDRFVWRNWMYRDRIIPVKEVTLYGMMRISELAPDFVPDLIYVDANHAYEAARADIDMAYKLWPSVVLVGDDWDPAQFPGVIQAVEESRDRYGMELEQQGKAWKLKASGA